jgi:hypothetical protein
MNYLTDMAAKLVVETGGFNGDQILAIAAAEVIKGRSYIVETGTWHGETTRWFRRMFPLIKYQGIELDPDKWWTTTQNVPDADVSLMSSKAWLAAHLHQVGDHPFFFLDAHGYNDTRSHQVLDDELEVLGLIDDPCILVHDYDDGTGLPHEPGNGPDGPVTTFVKLRPDLGLYYCKEKLSVVGAALIAKPFESEYWTLASNILGQERTL